MTTTDGEARERPNIEVYTVAFAAVPREGLFALVQRRSEDPAAGEWAIPGITLGEYTSLSEAARQVVSLATGIYEVPQVEQVYTRDHEKNDPRGWGASIIYYATLPSETLLSAVATKADALMAKVEDARADNLRLIDGTRETINLALDHHQVVTDAVKKLQKELWYLPKAGRRELPMELLDLLPERFTLTEFQQVCETIIGHKVNKDDFRRRVTATYPMVEPTGKYGLGPIGRPAQLFKAIEQ